MTIRRLAAMMATRPRCKQRGCLFKALEPRSIPSLSSQAAMLIERNIIDILDLGGPRAFRHLR